MKYMYYKKEKKKRKRRKHVLLPPGSLAVRWGETERAWVTHHSSSQSAIGGDIKGYGWYDLYWYMDISFAAVLSPLKQGCYASRYKIVALVCMHDPRPMAKGRVVNVNRIWDTHLVRKKAQLHFKKLNIRASRVRGYDAIKIYICQRKPEGESLGSGNDARSLSLSFSL